MPEEKQKSTCPICGKPVDYFAEPLGPFCSARCKMVDLGRWFGEDYKFSDPLRPDHFAAYDPELGDSQSGGSEDE